MPFSDEELPFWACPPRRVVVGEQGASEIEVIVSDRRAKWMERVLLPHTVLLAIAQGADRPVHANHGTGMLLSTGAAEMIVTNGHVYDRFLELKSADPTTRLGMSGAEGRGFLDISAASVLGKEKRPDLVTLAVPREAVEAYGKRFLTVSPWPPPRVRKGMLGYLIGYAAGALVVSNGVAQQRLLSLGMPVEFSNEHDFFLHDEKDDVIETALTDSGKLKHLGGISGCAVYIWNKAAGPIDRASFLGGFAYQGMGTKSVLAVHADFINADGTIR